MTNILGHHSTGNGETLNICEQGRGIISAGLQKIDLAASSGKESSEQGKMRGRQNTWGWVGGGGGVLQ